MPPAPSPPPRLRRAAVAAALLWLAAPALAGQPTEQLKLVPPARMAGFQLRALWEARYAAALAGHLRGEVWKVDAAYDFALGLPPRDGAGRPLPDVARPACPARREHGIPVTLTVTAADDAPAPCDARDGDVVPLGAGCAVLRHNVGDRKETEGAWALDFREADLGFTLRLGPESDRWPGARAQLLAAAAEARAWAAALVRSGGAEVARLAVQRAASEAAVAAGRAELEAPPACRP